MKPLTPRDVSDLVTQIPLHAGVLLANEIRQITGCDTPDTTAARKFFEEEVADAVRRALNRFNASQKRVSTIATARQRTAEQQKLAADAKKLAATKKK